MSSLKNNAALQQLKASMDADKTFLTGRVSGSLRGFGFLNPEDKNTEGLFIPPPEMRKLLPGDEARMVVETAPDGRQSGRLDKILVSKLDIVFGRVVSMFRNRKGFQLDDFNNKVILPIPRKDAEQYQVGDMVKGKVIRHPSHKDGGMVKILASVGSLKNPGTPIDYAKLKFGLPGVPDNKVALSTTYTEREELTHIPFTTIDSFSTRDIDDALFAESLDDGGVRLWVAIADVEHVVPEGSDLDRLSAERATSLYLPGQSIPMLPEEVTYEAASLLPNEERPALLAIMDFDAEGNMVAHEFKEALIRSHAKLTYQVVQELLSDRNIRVLDQITDDQALSNSISDSLFEMKRFTDVQIAKRSDEPERDSTEYRYHFDQNGQVVGVKPMIRYESFKIVENCMLAANHAAARLLVEKGAKAPFRTHGGLDEMQREEFETFLSRLDIDGKFEDFDDADRFRELTARLSSMPYGEHLVVTVTKFLKKSTHSTKPGPHFGLGVEAYTTMTSPIRKRSDILVHRLIKAILRGEALPEVSEKEVEIIDDKTKEARLASRECEHWLNLVLAKDIVGKTFEATVVNASNRGFMAIIDEMGVRGFVDFARDNPEREYDKVMQWLDIKKDGQDERIHFGRKVKVEVDRVDLDRQAVVFKWSGEFE